MMSHPTIHEVLAARYEASAITWVRISDPIPLPPPSRSEFEWVGVASLSPRFDQRIDWGRDSWVSVYARGDVIAICLGGKYIFSFDFHRGWGNSLFDETTCDLVWSWNRGVRLPTICMRSKDRRTMYVIDGIRSTRLDSQGVHHTHAGTTRSIHLPVSLKRRADYFPGIAPYRLSAEDVKGQKVILVEQKYKLVPLDEDGEEPTFHLWYIIQEHLHDLSKATATDTLFYRD